MLENLSFRAKLITLLGAAIIGFVIVALVALNGLNVQNDASNKFENLTKVDKDLDSMTISLMEQYEALSQLNDESFDAFLTQLDSNFSSLNTTLDENTQLLDDEESKQKLNDVKMAVTDYNQSLTALVVQQHKVGFSSTSGIKNKIAQQGEAVTEEVSFLSLIKQEFLPVREAEKNFIFEPSEANRTEFQARFDKFYERVVNFGLEERFGPIINTYLEATKEFEQESNTLNTNLEQFKTSRQQYTQIRTEASELMQNMVSQARQQADDSAQQASVSLILVSIAVAVVASLMMMGIGRSVNKTLTQIISDLGKVKSGDLTARLAVNNKRNDEFDSLCASVNEMTNGLGSVIGDVVSTTSDVNRMVSELNTAVQNIANSNHSVSEQTNSIAAATEEISVTISSISTTTDELSLQSQNTYESAKVGSETIKNALSSLTDTISVVNQTSGQLNELGQLSKDIDNVIGMINDLANQTNLLALNAAIEAARAGEAGRGFSVVADEVRSLAEKTVDATGKITDIVSTIQTSTQSAINTMKEGQQSLQSIEEFSEKADLAIKEIEQNAQTSSTSSVDMARSIQEVAKTAIHMSEEMDKIAQQLQNDNKSINSIEANTRHIHDQVSGLDSKTNVFTTK